MGHGRSSRCAKGASTVRAVVQRVRRAQVAVDARLVGAIERGLCVFVGVTHSDTAEQASTLARKLWGLRIFEDAEGKMNLACRDVGGAILIVSQFTLYGDVSKGRRPAFTGAARPEVAEPLIEQVVADLRALGARVGTGVFGADMDVSVLNDGPVTLIIDVP